MLRAPAALALLLVPGLLEAANPPRTLREHLARRHRRATLARVDPEIRDALRADSGQDPAWFGGDLDGDGKRDYAVYLEEDGRALVIALLARPKGFSEHRLREFEPNQRVFIQREPRGSTVHDHERAEDLVLAHDSVSINHFEKAGETFVWQDGSFRSLISSD